VKARRSKWASRHVQRSETLLVAVAALLLVIPYPGIASAAVPLPKPRPAAAPAAIDDAPSAAEATDEQAEPEPAPQAVAPQANTKPLSPCRLALTEQIAIAPSIPDIKGPGACGGEDLVRLEAVVLPDHSQVVVKPAAVLRCAMARELVNWVREDLSPLAATRGTAIVEIDNFDAYECRGRNRQKGGKLSEHGRANAIDIRALKLANGQTVSLTDRTVPRALREKVVGSVCARFSTVLGPGSDGYHEDHVHLDLAPGRPEYRVCNWHVWEALPQVAPLLPAVRPDEAPPRPGAEGGAAVSARPAAVEEPAAGDSQQVAEPDGLEAEAPPVAAKPAKSKQATKKRREHRRL